MKIKFYWPVFAASQKWLLIAVVLGYLSAFACYLLVKPSWLASLEVQVPSPTIGITNRFSAIYNVTNSDYRKIFDTIGDPIFTEKLTDIILKPELFNVLLDKRFAGSGYVQVIEKSDKRLALIVRSNDKMLSLELANAIGDMVLGKIAEDRETHKAHLLIMRNEINSRLSFLTSLDLQKKFAEIGSYLDDLTLAELMLLASGVGDIESYIKKLHDLKYETYYLDNIFSSMSTTADIRVMTFMYPEQAWPRPKFFMLLGTLCAVFLMLLVLLKNGFLRQEKTS